VIALCESPRGLERPFRNGDPVLLRPLAEAATRRAEKRTLDVRLAPESGRKWARRWRSACDLACVKTLANTT
jgi:hypothetical protein